MADSARSGGYRLSTRLSPARRRGARHWERPAMTDNFDTDSTDRERRAADARRLARFRPARRRVAVAAVAVGFATIGLVGVAAADPSVHTTTYSACVSTQHTLYHVTVNSTGAPHCTGRDAVITWNQTGPRGPAG